jgi:DNA-binding transcriptional ArsR family regulator
MDINAAMNAFEALSQETRLGVLRLLVQAGPDGLPAGEIAEILDCRQNTMSTHLRILDSSGLIGSRRQGRNIIYSADFRTVRALVLFLMEDCCAGNAAVCRPVAESLASSGI